MYTIPLIDTSRRRDFSTKLVIFSPHGHFFRPEYLSNYHRYMTKQRPTEALHQFHSIELVNALRMGLSSSIFHSALTPSVANVFLLVPTFVSPSRVNPVHNVAADDSVDDNDNGQISRSPRNSNTSMYWRSDGSRNSNADRTRTSQQARWLVWLLSFGALEIATWEKWEVTTGWWKIGHFNRFIFQLVTCHFRLSKSTWSAPESELRI